MPTYLNYQSTELAKALLLFENPGVIYKNDEEAINLFKVAGASCYGLSKESYNHRVK
jgi:DNA-directed RNA polymerase